jgi:3-oxoacyl-[acyl-carrier protein] reductase
MVRMTESRDLSGKVAIVTGAAVRMGRAIAMRLAEAGAAVLVNTRSSIDQANQVAREIERSGGKAIAIAADVTNPASVLDMVDQCEKLLGRIDILVNNVSVRYRTPFQKISLAEWRGVLSSTLDGAFLCSQACATQLVANHGSIVNIGGASAYFGSGGHAHVMTAKLGLVGLTRALALDLAPNVVVNCLAPGRIDAEGDTHPVMTGQRAYTLDRIPASRAGTLEEVAEGVAMLCSPRSRFINGQTVHINGGMFFGS